MWRWGRRWGARIVSHFKYDRNIAALQLFSRRKICSWVSKVHHFLNEMWTVRQMESCGLSSIGIFKPCRSIFLNTSIFLFFDGWQQTFGLFPNESAHSFETKLNDFHQFHEPQVWNFFVKQVNFRNVKVSAAAWSLHVHYIMHYHLFGTHFCSFLS